MISIVSFPSESSPILGRIQGIRKVVYAKKPRSVAEAIGSAIDIEDDTGLVFFVAPGGKIRSARIWPTIGRSDWDVAARVDRIGNPPRNPGVFDGIGRIDLSTVLVRANPAGRSFLDRWRFRNGVSGSDEAVNLAVSLTEVREVRFLELGREWVWREEEDRPFVPDGEPVVEFKSESAPVQIAEVGGSFVSNPVRQPKSPEVVMVSHFSQFTGYGKMAREILFRLALSMNVRIDDSHNEPVYVDADLQRRIDAHKTIPVSSRAPLLRIMGPDYNDHADRYRIVWTMQETSRRVHDDMVKRANGNFSELWTPTQWNADVFRESGIKLPMRVVPLGINPLIFHPWLRRPLPPCRRISGPKAGSLSIPKGYVFFTVGLPGRKGWGVIADALALAFEGRSDVHLVIGLTHSPPAWNQKVYKQFARYKVPIWTLEGSFSEHELARIYSSCDAYVSASHGEGFNLPAAEAAACGLPVILPNNTVHPEIFGPEAYLFDGDGERLFPEWDSISDWYKGQVFTYFGKRAVRRLADVLKHVHSGTGVDTRAASLCEKIISRYTWDRTAEKVVPRLIELNERTPS